MHSLRDGQKEEAQRLENEMREIHKRDAAIRAEITKTEAAMRGDRGDDAGDRERRLRHLRVAAENLHAAGLHEAAQHVIGQIERLERAPRDGAPGEYRPGTPQQPDGQLQREVHNLHRQMEQMREEMRGLREALKHVIDSRTPDR
jgi:predicted  nucleic acid-binding Zn-ribbon protein